MKKIFISGHQGMVGSALIRFLKKDNKPFKLVTRSRSELDLCNQSAVNDFFETEKPDVVINAAAKVGGIYANKTYPAEFIRDNIFININLIDAAWKFGVSKFLNLGSSCIYPKNAMQPLSEKALLCGPLESTNAAYALAKISGLEMCRYYRKQYGVKFYSAMPTNLYGPGDNYHTENSHVLPALIRRFHEAKINNSKEVCIWGSGNPRREFLHVDDLAEALFFLLSIENPPDWINIGTGKDQSILELANLVKEIIGFKGGIINDTSKPDGTLVKRLNISLLKSLGWTASISIEQGIVDTYKDFLESEQKKTLRV